MEGRQGWGGRYHLCSRLQSQERKVRNTKAAEIFIQYNYVTTCHLHASLLHSMPCQNHGTLVIYMYFFQYSSGGFMHCTFSALLWSSPNSLQAPGWCSVGDSFSSPPSHH